MPDEAQADLSPEAIAEIAARRDAGAPVDAGVAQQVAEVKTEDAPPVAPVEVQGDGSEDYEPGLIIFREVPGYDERTLVLSYGENFIDLQFCGCINKYKKRFSSFMTETPEFLGSVRDYAVQLAENGYKAVDIKDVLEYLRGQAKANTPAAEYLAKYPHDFELDSLPRAYLTRKLMMEEPKLFGFFELSPVKCRSSCGYPEASASAVEEESTSIAGF